MVKIFQQDPDGYSMWLESAPNLDTALARIAELSKKHPNDWYFFFDEIRGPLPPKRRRRLRSAATAHGRQAKHNRNGGRRHAKPKRLK